MYPINFNFVTPQKITISENGEPKELTVLTFDEAANTDYWKRLGCFGEQLEALELKDPSEAVAWHISTAWTQNSYMEDVLRHTHMALGYPDPENPLIYGIPVEFIEDEREFVVLELLNNKLEENNNWK